MTHQSEDQDFCLYRDRGSSEALARVFDALAPRLLLLAAHLAPDAAQAEDLVQTTFLQAMRDAQRYDGTRPVAAWLAGILNHRALDARRRSGSRATQQLQDEMQAGASALQLDPAQLAADDELLERITGAIDEIDDPYRDVLALRVVHGLTPTAIAHTLGRSPGTVRMQLKRGLERLRRAMPERAALFGVLFLEPQQGLDCIRQHVLAEANIGVTSAATAGAAGTTITHLLGGALLMKVLLATIVLLALGLGIYTFQSEELPAAHGATSSEESGTVLASSEPGGANEISAPDTAQTPAVNRLAVEQGVNEEAVPAEEYPLRARFASDDTAAADVGLYLRPAGGGALGTEHRTDARGEVHFAGLDPGSYLLHVDRLEDPLEVGLPLHAVFDLQIPAGVLVRGVVQDLEGNGVEGATIYRFNTLHHDVFQGLVKTGPGGRFELRDLAPRTELLARFPGFQPSDLETVRARAGEDEDVEFVLGAVGHRVHGRVLDPDGKPVPFAWIAIGTDEDSREELRGSTREPAAQTGKPLDLEGILLRADKHGVFESREIPAGYALVLARPVDPELNLVGHGSAWIRFGSEEELVIRLTRGAVIEGVVRDKHGRPVPGVRLEAEWEGTPLLGQMEDDVGPLVTDRFVMSDEHGAFRMPGLIVGDYDLRVEGTRERLVRAERQVGDGEVVSWNPVIENYASLAVRLLGPDGEPLAGWVVAANGTPGAALDWSFFQNVTDEQGRLLLADLTDEIAYEVCAYAPDAAQRFNRLAAIVRTEVAPGAQEFVLQASREDVQFGSVSGSWPQASGAVTPGPFLRLKRAGRDEELGARPAPDGAFEFRNLPAGSYTITIAGETSPLFEFDLAAGESRVLLK